MNVELRLLTEADANVIQSAFAEQGWNKPAELYLRYVQEQQQGARVTMVAEADGRFAGYGSVVWASDYAAFREAGVPEINDLNVLVKYRRQGVASRLMDEAERIIAERSSVAGIGVGLFSDYGNAQILYVKRGYVPDGRGIYVGPGYAKYGDTITVDDDLVLYLTKSLCE